MLLLFLLLLLLLLLLLIGGAEGRKGGSNPQEPQQLETIDVVWHEDQIYVAGTFNRRFSIRADLA